MPLPFLGYVGGVAAVAAIAGGPDEVARLLQEAGIVSLLSIVAGALCAIAAGVVAAVSGPRPLTTGLAAVPWIGSACGALLGAITVAEVIPVVNVADKATLAAAGCAEVLSSVIVGGSLGAGALLGAACAAAVRGVMAEHHNRDGSGAADLAGAAVSVVVAGAAIWSVMTAWWLREVLRFRASVSPADVAKAALVEPPQFMDAAAVIAVLGLAGLVSLAATRGPRVRLAGAAPGLAPALLAVVGAASVAIVGAALPADVDAVGAKLLVAEGTDAGRIADATRLSRGGTIASPVESDGLRSFRVALADDVDAATLRAAIVGAEEAKLSTLTLVTAPPTSPAPSDVVHPFLAVLDGVARGTETTFELCAVVDAFRGATVVVGDVWGIAPGDERPVITVGEGGVPDALAEAVADAINERDVCLVVGEPAQTLQAALALHKAGARLGLMSSMPPPPPPTDDVGAGILEKATIQNVIRGAQGDIRDCYERLLATSPTSQGKLTMQVVIGTDGGVTDVEVVSDTVASNELQRCVTKRIARLRFPRPVGGPVVVNYPFVFQPG